ncbi:hypothetical protein C8Q76DRAFT_753649 [Earliella scabrosa]|nr:hypothetical protein C8Q76DRAFT_753649 [Earliella scabrosa]
MRLLQRAGRHMRVLRDSDPESRPSRAHHSPVNPPWPGILYSPVRLGVGSHSCV